MNTAAAAAEYAANVGQDFSMIDALDAEYLDVEEDEVERQRINAAMAEWWS